MATLQEQRPNGQWMEIGSCSDGVVPQRIRQEASRRNGRVRAIDRDGRLLDLI